MHRLSASQGDPMSHFRQMIEDISAEERDQMAHAIGHHSSTSCSVRGGRNYYVTAADDPL